MPRTLKQASYAPEVSDFWRKEASPEEPQPAYGTPDFYHPEQNLKSARSPLRAGPQKPTHATALSFPNRALRSPPRLYQPRAQTIPRKAEPHRSSQHGPYPQ